MSIPITKVVQQGKKSCGCGSAAKMKSKEDKSSSKEPKFMEQIEINSETPAPIKMWGAAKVAYGKKK